MFNKIKSVIKRKFISQGNMNFPSEVQGNWHVNLILHLASISKPKVYVELGLYQCELFNQMIPFVDRLIGVDLSEEAGKFMKKNSKTNFVCSTTDDFARQAKADGLKIDMLFIDANHSYESVRNDFVNFFPMLKDNGLILLHDGYPKDLLHTQEGYCGDGYKAIEELTASQNGYEMVTIPIHPGLTIARKRSTHLLWKD